MAFSQMFTGWQPEWNAFRPLENPNAEASATAPPVAPLDSGLSSGAASAAGAGIGAAGSALGAIADAAARKAAMDMQLQQSNLGNLSSEKMAKMQLAANQEIFAGKKRDALQNMLLSALQSGANNIYQNRDLQRSANAGMNDILSRAFLRR